MSLEITTLIERPKVKIDGIEYQLKLSGELSEKDYIKITLLGERITGSEGKGKATAVKQGYDWIIKKILIAPRKIRKRLTIINKMAILRFFLENKKKEDDAIVKLSQGFNASTEEAQKIG
jgi:hypothetical protein